MSYVATAIAGGAAIGAIGSTVAAGEQASGQEQAAATQQDMFNTIVGQEQPFLNTGYGASTQLNELLGLPVSQGQLSAQGINQPSTASTAPTSTTATPTNPFNLANGGPTNWKNPVSSLAQPTGKPAATSTAPTTNQPSIYNGTVPGTNLPAGYLSQTFNPTLSQLVNYPGYGFQLNTGTQSVNNANAPGSGALSGAAMKGLSTFTQGTAASNYGNFFNQFQTQQNNIFDRLSSLASLGQNAAGNLGSTGATLGTGIAQAQAAAAGSQAAGIVGATNSITGGVNTGIGLNYLLAGNQGSQFNNIANDYESGDSLIP